MLKFFYVLLPVSLLLCAQQATAQTPPPVLQAFSSAFGKGDTAGLNSLLHEEVELVERGKSGTYQRQVVAGKLADFFRANPPAGFQLRHQGSSADGQLYAIGQLTTQSGSSVKVLIRARALPGNQYKIIKLDLL
ncbi:DUF4783 domain-containing protein [Cesiribacter andamanensis]|uniref:DUF4783 domain-containing protein n=1 Tax=Cesiribacter andamanensis AMV16 TaxID=1279009 RepID=M7NT33_9BACT|nr:DUF4783 domain-containing protein [Cesiribacter andamanensis]EMR01644.1 hypothetical protein ADICEAN_03218 [Cesiribacter andamanensis AMV16]